MNTESIEEFVTNEPQLINNDFVVTIVPVMPSKIDREQWRKRIIEWRIEQRNRELDFLRVKT